MAAILSGNYEGAAILIAAGARHELSPDKDRPSQGGSPPQEDQTNENLGAIYTISLYDSLCLSLSLSLSIYIYIYLCIDRVFLYMYIQIHVYDMYYIYIYIYICISAEDKHEIGMLLH